jgi:hypothetical protein
MSIHFPLALLSTVLVFDAGGAGTDSRAKNADGVANWSTAGKRARRQRRNRKMPTWYSKSATA